MEQLDLKYRYWYAYGKMCHNGDRTYYAKCNECDHFICNDSLDIMRYMVDTGPEKVHLAVWLVCMDKKVPPACYTCGHDGAA